MYMHYNHCHRATAHLQLNIFYYYLLYKLYILGSTNLILIQFLNDKFATQKLQICYGSQ